MFFGLNKYVIYAIGAAILLAVITTYVLMWKHSIRQQALLEFNNKQLEQVIKDQQTFMNQMKELSVKQESILSDLKKKNEELSGKLSEIDTYLTTEETKPENNTQSSEVLKNTIKGLERK